MVGSPQVGGNSQMANHQTIAATCHRGYGTTASIAARAWRMASGSG
jgi:hypothetical protein